MYERLGKWYSDRIALNYISANAGLSQRTIDKTRGNQSARFRAIGKRKAYMALLWAILAVEICLSWFLSEVTR